MGTPAKHSHASSKGLLGRMGVSLSLLCAIHCLAMPGLLIAMPLLGNFFQQFHWVDWLLVGSSAFFGGIVLIRDYRQHGWAVPLALFLFGVIWFASMELVDAPFAETLHSLGSIFIAIGLLLNFNKMRRSQQEICCTPA